MDNARERETESGAARLEKTEFKFMGGNKGGNKNGETESARKKGRVVRCGGRYVRVGAGCGDKVTPNPLYFYPLCTGNFVRVSKSIPYAFRPLIFVSLTIKRQPQSLTDFHPCFLIPYHPTPHPIPYVFLPVSSPWWSSYMGYVWQPDAWQVVT
jgi:hypothetical protein